MHVTSYLSLPWTSPCISVKQIFLNLSTYEIPFGLKTYNGFQFFTELSTPALPWHAKPYLHNLAPTDLSRFIFYCFTVIFAPPSSFASLRVGALPSLSVLFQKLAPLSFLLYQKPTTWGDCPCPSVPGIPPWNSRQSFPDTSQALRAPSWTNQQTQDPAGIQLGSESPLLIETKNFPRDSTGLPSLGEEKGAKIRASLSSGHCIPPGNISLPKPLSPLTSVWTFEGRVNR